MNRYELIVVGIELLNFIYNDFLFWYIELLRIYLNKKYVLENLRRLFIIVYLFLFFVIDYLY